jgi:hypothetical protein
LREFKKLTYFVFQSAFFMSVQNQQTDTLKDVRDIRQMMERSSRFTSLSGLSCVAAGICALIGAFIAYRILHDYYGDETQWEYSTPRFYLLRQKLLILAAVVFAAAMLTAFFFTWRKSTQQGISLLSHTSRRVFWNMAIPLGTGIVFVFAMFVKSDWDFIAPGCLIFYGLALINAGKYTVADIRYLGYCEIILGITNLLFVSYGIYFWAIGFGLLHVIYGVSMWWKYERGAVK